MGSMYSKGLLDEDFKELLQLCSTLAELKSIYQKFYQRNVCHSFSEDNINGHMFLTKETFAQTFPTLPEKTNVFMKFCTQNVISNRKKKFYEQVRICALTLFGGLALVTKGDMLSKLRFGLYLLYPEQSASGTSSHIYFNPCELSIIISSVSTGLSILKKINPPPEKIILRLVDRIFAKDSEYGGGTIEAKTMPENNASVMREISFDRVLSLSSDEPDILYYMYDLSIKQETNLGGIIQEQEVLFQELTKLNADLAIIEMNENFKDLDLQAELGNDFAIEKYTKTYNSNKKNANRWSKGLLSMQDIDNFSRNLTEEFAKLKSHLPFKNAKIQIQVNDLQNLVKSVTGGGLLILYEEAKVAFHQLPFDQLGYIDVFPVAHWFKQWAVEMNKHVPTSWEKFAGMLAKQINSIPLKIQSVLHNLKEPSFKSKGTKHFGESHFSVHMRFGNKASRESDKDSFIKKCGIQLDCESRAGRYRRDDNRGDFDSHNLQELFLNGAHSILSLILLVDANTTENEIIDYCKALEVYLNDELVLEHMSEVWSSANVDIVHGSQYANTDLLKTYQANHEFAIQVTFILNMNFIKEFQKAFGVNLADVLEEVSISIELSQTLNEVLQHSYQYYNLMNAVEEREIEGSNIDGAEIHTIKLTEPGIFLVKRIFDKFDADKDGILNYQEINNMQQDLKQPPFSSVDEYKKILEEFNLTSDPESGFLTFEGLVECYEMCDGLLDDIRSLGIGSVNDIVSGKLQFVITTQTELFRQLESRLLTSCWASWKEKFAWFFCTYMNDLDIDIICPEVSFFPYQSKPGFIAEFLTTWSKKEAEVVESLQKEAKKTTKQLDVEDLAASRIKGSGAKRKACVKKFLVVYEKLLKDRRIRGISYGCFKTRGLDFHLECDNLVL